MANIKDVKKDIRFLCEQLIVESLVVAELVGKDEMPGLVALVSEIAIFHNDLISRVNHPDGKENHKLVKEYFKAISNDLLVGCDEFYNRLNQLIPSEK